MHNTSFFPSQNLTNPYLFIITEERMKFLHVILYSGVAIRKYIMNLKSVYDRQWGRGRLTSVGSCNPDTQIIRCPQVLGLNGRLRELLLLFSLTHVQALRLHQHLRYQIAHSSSGAVMFKVEITIYLPPTLQVQFIHYSCTTTRKREID